MFHNIPDAVLDRMRELEQMNTDQKRTDMPAFERLRQVPPITGRFLAMAASGAPDGSTIEIGTSGGYSGLWISLACRERGQKLTTFELAAPKVELARETFRVAGVDDIVTVVEGDAREFLADHKDVGFCFLDTEKGLYEECYEAVVPNMVKGGILVADNMVSHAGDLATFLDRAESDTRVDSLVVPVGSGLLLTRRI
jgi:predicted O-methyltransferase YrrM